MRDKVLLIKLGPYLTAKEGSQGSSWEKNRNFQDIETFCFSKCGDRVW